MTGYFFRTDSDNKWHWVEEPEIAEEQTQIPFSQLANQKMLDATEKRYKVETPDRQAFSEALQLRLPEDDV